MRAHIESGITVAEFIQMNMELSLNVFEHQNYPIENLAYSARDELRKVSSDRLPGEQFGLVMLNMGDSLPKID